MKDFIMQSLFSAVLGGFFGAFISYIFWKRKFQTQLRAEYYREVLEKLICPFYLWLLYGRIRAEDRTTTTTLPPEERELLISFPEGEDQKIIDILRQHLHLAAGDSRLFKQIEEFFRCREYNFNLPETRRRVYKLYQTMSGIYSEYAEKYKKIVGG